MRYALAIVILLLAGCATKPPVAAPNWSAEHRNACVPEAAAMAKGLQGAGIQAHVLLIYTPAWNHAVTSYLYPTGQNRLWVWDSTWKSIELRSYFADPAMTARAWLSATGRSPSILTSAKFLE